RPGGPTERALNADLVARGAAGPLRPPAAPKPVVEPPASGSLDRLPTAVSTSNGPAPSPTPPPSASGPAVRHDPLPSVVGTSNGPAEGDRLPADKPKARDQRLSEESVRRLAWALRDANETGDAEGARQAMAVVDALPADDRARTYRLATNPHTRIESFPADEGAYHLLADDLMAVLDAPDDADASTQVKRILLEMSPLVGRGISAYDAAKAMAAAQAAFEAGNYGAALASGGMAVVGAVDLFPGLGDGTRAAKGLVKLAQLFLKRLDKAGKVAKTLQPVGQEAGKHLARMKLAKWERNWKNLSDSEVLDSLVNDLDLPKEAKEAYKYVLRFAIGDAGDDLAQHTVYKAGLNAVRTPPKRRATISEGTQTLGYRFYDAMTRDAIDTVAGFYWRPIKGRKGAGIEAKTLEAQNSRQEHLDSFVSEDDLARTVSKDPAKEVIEMEMVKHIRIPIRDIPDDTFRSIMQKTVYDEAIRRGLMDQDMAARALEQAMRIKNGKKSGNTSVGAFLAVAIGSFAEGSYED
ncbi:MAG: hypothetical protein KDE22_15460, partial [Rhodobacterales bacterium]|nr:hypothetical protein [Rhodobacterales bacterium]